jgi:hypothetical protein
MSNKMQRYTVYFYLETAVYVSGGNTTHHQERTQLYLQYLLIVTLLLLRTAIAANSSNGVTNTRNCRYSCFHSWWWVMVPAETCTAVSRWNKLFNVASSWTYIRILKNLKFLPIISYTTQPRVCFQNLHINHVLLNRCFQIILQKFRLTPRMTTSNRLV